MTYTDDERFGILLLDGHGFEYYDPDNPNEGYIVADRDSLEVLRP